MHEISSFDCSRIAQDLQIRKVQVEAVVQLLDEGNTVPFITRYRKERTGGLDEEVIRQIQTRIAFLRQLADRKQTILKSLETQGKLSDELRHSIETADTTKRLEDLYLPYKPKKKSLASTARERGLEPLALAVWNRDPAVGQFEELLPSLVNPEKSLASADDVRAGVQHILAEMMAETAALRAEMRIMLWETSKVRALKSEKLGEGQGMEYKDYFDFTEPARQIPAHRILALNRGEKENALKVRLEFDHELAQRVSLGIISEHLQKMLTTPAVSTAVRARPAPVTLEPPPAPSATEVAVSAPEPTPMAPADASGGSPTPLAEGPSADPVASAPPDESAGLASPPAETPASDPVISQAATQPPAEAPPAPPAEPLVPPTLPPPVSVPGQRLSPEGEYETPHAALLRKVLEDALTRLLLPSLEREIRHELTDEAESHAVAVFARNLRSLLLQPPLHHRRILAIDPGLRTGCKVAVLDEFGTLLDNTVVFPFGSHPRKGPKEKKPQPDSATPAPAAEPQASAEQTTTAPSEPVADPTASAPVEQAAVQPATVAESPAAPVATAEQAPEPMPPSAPPEQPPSSSTEAAPTVSEAPAEAPPVAAAEGTAATPPAETAPAGDANPQSAIRNPPPEDRKAEVKAKLKDLLTKYQVQTIALGNGTGCRETEEIIADIIASDLPELAYVIVNEAGASVYSVSAYGREEFPNFDSTLRSTISIGRRLQDPLAELVKVDPPNIGVGLYQHDINRKDLRESLDGVVESCVNSVGVDLNTASVPLLRHVSGLNQLVARELVEHRQKSGAFTSREQLQQVPGLGPARFIQAAGFLKIPGGSNPLDRTWIHPESYPLAEKILEELGYTPRALDDKSALEELQGKLKAVNPEDLARKLGAGVPTVYDIVLSLERPGRDPREDLPAPIFKKGILKLEDLQVGMELKGTVLNVVDFGAFVDIGLHDSGLVHISQMANRYIKSPYDVAAVSDVVTVWVLNVDKDRHRVSLTMIKPGTERKPQEKRPLPPREQRSRAPRDRQPQPAGAGPGGPPQQGQGQGQDQGGRQRQDNRGRRPQHGRSGPGRRGGPPQHAQVPTGEGQTTETPKAPPPPPPPPRKPRRELPKPKLSQEALEGRAPLRTFGELSVLFATKNEKKPEPEPTPAAVPEPPAPPDPV